MKTRAFTPISTRYGMFSIDPDHDKKMANRLIRGEYPSEDLLSISRPFIKKNSNVVDIGAHVGTFSIPLRSVAGKVIAFEPSTEAFTLLTQNSAANGAAYDLRNKALGKETGTGMLITRNAQNAGANTIVSGTGTKISTLDREVGQADFIKIDVEGMELDVLRGGVKLIERARPTILFEVNLSQLRAHGTSLRALAQFFTKRDYHLYIPLPDAVLGRVHSVTLLAACIAPRSWFFWSDSAPFDLIAVPEERTLPLPSVGFTVALLWAFKRNIALKAGRLSAFVRN